MDTTVESDCNAIRALISRQFASMSWKAAGEPDWEKFRSDFFSGCANVSFIAAGPAPIRPRVHQANEFSRRKRPVVA